MRRIFRPKSEIQTLFQAKSRHLLHNFGTNLIWGGCFHFFTKIPPQKHQKRAILHTLQANGGARAPPAPPWLRYCWFSIDSICNCIFLPSCLGQEKQRSFGLRVKLPTANCQYKCSRSCHENCFILWPRNNTT